MCWQDVQIGRATTIRSLNTAGSPGDQNVTFGIWSRRIRIVISCDYDTATSPAPRVHVWRSSTLPDNTTLIASTTLLVPLVLDLEKYGSVVQGELRVKIFDDGGGGLSSITEYEVSEEFIRQQEAQEPLFREVK